MPMANTTMVSINAGICRKMFANIATISSKTPIIRNLPMPDRSRLMVLASVAIAKKISAVPPAAVATSVPPLFRFKTLLSKRDSISPIKKVKPSSIATPHPLFLVFSMA